ncbi:GAF domain-containing protein [Chondromyces apiculatus]|uniref:RsbR, positive regulator of sigma-B n=1 Tax=Chondromyces apiculatus DSM 436 TaxID=1192034 RepID=A0A017T4F8_9BACT|nr:GAF domain-containing protein [Chondromyces apiculatus]EYF03892.1 RsbR, positive regulator of sigma-B [Chondromyces apiculatus DSM 436]
MQIGLELISFLAQSASNLAAAGDLASLSSALEALLHGLVPVEYAGFFLNDPCTGKLCMLVATGFSREEREAAERTAMDRHPGWVIRNRQVLHVPDVDQDPEHLTSDSPRSVRVRARMFVPVLTDEGCVGTLGIASSRPHAFNEAHLESLLLIARLGAVAYVNIARFKQLDEQLATIRAQQHELLALSAPVIALDADLLLVPITGRLDPERASRLTERLLAEVTARGAQGVVLDLTGLGSLDAEAIASLARIAAATSLLGSRCVVCGMSPALARDAVALLGSEHRLRATRTLREALSLLAAPPALSLTTAPRR